MMSVNDGNCINFKAVNFKKESNSPTKWKVTILSKR